MGRQSSVDVGKGSKIRPTGPPIQHHRVKIGNFERSRREVRDVQTADANRHNLKQDFSSQAKTVIAGVVAAFFILVLTAIALYFMYAPQFTAVPTNYVYRPSLDAGAPNPSSPSPSPPSPAPAPA